MIGNGVISFVDDRLGTLCCPIVLELASLTCRHQWVIKPKHDFTFTLVDFEGEIATRLAAPTFMRKNVMLVRRSTVDLRSCSFSGDEAGKLFRYMLRSIRSELCSWSSSLTNFSFWKVITAEVSSWGFFHVECYVLCGSFLWDTRNYDRFSASWPPVSGSMEIPHRKQKPLRWNEDAHALATMRRTADTFGWQLGVCRQEQTVSEMHTMKATAFAFRGAESLDCFRTLIFTAHWLPACEVTKQDELMWFVLPIWFGFSDIKLAW